MSSFKLKFTFIFVFPFILLSVAFAQSDSLRNDGVITGNFYLQAQLYNADSSINAKATDERLLMNAMGNVRYTYKKITVGARYEAYLNALQGFDPRYNGNGISHRFFSFRNEKIEFTLGNFYEQFGSGMVLRSYEDKNLGYDNAFDGILMKWFPHNGITLKALAGKQRLYWEKGDGLVRGVDMEMDLFSVFSIQPGQLTQVNLGASFVSKFQADDHPLLRLPQSVGAGAMRLQINRLPWTLEVEYVRKANDPSADNGLIYKSGEALLCNVSYSVKGLGVHFQAKRIDNMAFRSDRYATNNDLHINFLPPIIQQNSLTLASLYPYATQSLGEVGYQFEIVYTFKRNTWLGGKYGTQLNLHLAKVQNLKTTPDYTGLGYHAVYFPFGNVVYYTDAHLNVKKRLNKNVKVSASYFYLEYNKKILEGDYSASTVYAQIFAFEADWKINSKNGLRMDFQHLQTKQDVGNWAFLQFEYTYSPHWFVSVADMYNYGATNVHFPILAGGYTSGATRVQLRLGRQKEGIVCVGGVCRYAPATSGLSLMLSTNF